MPNPERQYTRLRPSLELYSRLPPESQNLVLLLDRLAHSHQEMPDARMLLVRTLPCDKAKVILRQTRQRPRAVRLSHRCKVEADQRLVPLFVQKLAHFNAQLVHFVCVPFRVHAMCGSGRQR